MERTVIATAKPFRFFPRGEYRFLVDEDGRVWVWDDQVAHQYTSCHSLSERAQRRIRALAERACA